MTARLHLAYAGVRHAFTTRNTHVPARSVLRAAGRRAVLDARRHCGSSCRSAALAGSSGQRRTACKIEFELDYAFASQPLETVLSPVFDKIANTLVDRFVQRAEAVYGAR